VFDDAGVYFTMRCIAGDTLNSIINNISNDVDDYRRKYTLRRLVGIFLSVCNAVAFAHSKGVMHGDLKPGNVMVGQYGEVLVMDWGLAHNASAAEDQDENLRRALIPEKRAAVSDIGGTPVFMAPEHVSGEYTVPDRKSEVYALGAILYSILTLKSSPFSQEKSPRRLARQIVSGRPELPRRAAPKFHTVPRELEAICLKAMEKDRKKRYSDVDELILDIMNYLDGRPVKAYSPFIIYRLQKHIIRRPLIPVVIFVLVSLSLLFYQWNLVTLRKDQLLHQEIASGAVAQGTGLSRMLKVHFRKMKKNGVLSPERRMAEQQLFSTLMHTVNIFDAALSNLENMPIASALPDAKIAVSDLIVTGIDLNTYDLSSEIFCNFTHARNVLMADFVSVIDRHRKLADAVVQNSPRLKEMYGKLTGSNGRVRFPDSTGVWRLSVADISGCRIIKDYVPDAGAEIELPPGEYKFTFTGKDGNVFHFPVSVHRANIFVCDIAFPQEQIPEKMVYIPGGAGAESIHGFFIRKSEVSIAEYIGFWKTFPENIRDSRTIYFYCDKRHKFFPLWDKSGSVTAPYKASDPVFGVSVSDAQAYCRWMSRKSGRLIRLPMREEWSRAAFDFDKQSSVAVYGVESLDYTIREMLGGGKLDLNKKHIGFRYVMDMKKR
jgi:serine/threonine protein kinase